MAQLVQLKRSAVANQVPTTGQLSLGELAINTFDGKLYLKKNNGTDSIIRIGIDYNITVGTTAPSSPSTNDIWIDTN